MHRKAIKKARSLALYRFDEQAAARWRQRDSDVSAQGEGKVQEV
jgi:uncharacterized protein YaeQ